MAREIRGDVQGLRAVAVLTVIAGHYGVPHLSGGFIGVDVFYVISGYLISSLLYREMSVRGRVSLATFWSRRARRILPAATVVTTVTLVVSLFYLSILDARQVVTDSIWATLFAANIHFAQIGTDYFDKDLAPSPVQHYWSLAVEEQFYLVWPLLLIVCLLLSKLTPGRRSRARRARKQRLPRRVVFLVLALVTAGSFYWSVVQTVDNPNSAYFSTFTRGWELAIGALAALVTPRFTRSLRAGTVQVAAVLGLTAIVASCLVYTEATQFPGYAAALPVLGTALLLVAGAGNHHSLIARGLALKPMRRVGDWSYSLYLWHWPVLILLPHVLKIEDRALSAYERALAVVLVFLLAALTYRLVEMPFRNGRPARVLRVRRALVLYPISLAMVAATAGYAWYSTGIQGGEHGDNPPIVVAGPPGRTSVAALVKASVEAGETGRALPSDLNPDLFKVRESVADVGKCDYQVDVTILCPRGDTDGDRTVILIGDSHARAWIPAFDTIAAEGGWRAYYFVKPQCTAAHVTVAETDDPSEFEECDRFHDWVIDQVEELHPELVVVATSPPVNGVFTPDRGRVSSINRMRPALREGYRDLFLSLKEATAQRVVLLRDVPKSSTDPTTCLGTGDPNLGTCSFTPEERSRKLGNIAVFAAENTDTEVVDPLPWLCYRNECPVVIGGVISYRDTDHITIEYAESLAPALGKALRMLPHEIE